MSKKNVKIAVAGSAGRMGKMLVNVIDKHPNCSLVAATCHPKEIEIIGADAGIVSGINKANVAISSDPRQLLNGDVIIDFTSPESTINHSFLAVEKKIGHVIGTTGLSVDQEKVIKKNSEKAPIIYSANMSVGVNLLFSLVKKAVASIDDNWDIEILEMHHRNKVDAPSGTALALGKVASDTKNIKFEKVSKLSREGKVGERKTNEIGFATLRGGSVVGDHSIILAHDDERIELTHKASNRKIYANGAVKAAIWCSQKEKGLFDMSKVLGL